MNIKYTVSKLENSKVQEIKDSVSIEEPLEMRLKYKKMIIGRLKTYQ